MLLPDSHIEEIINTKCYEHNDFTELFERFPLSDFSFHSLNGNKMISFCLSHNDTLSIGFMRYSPTEAVHFQIDGHHYSPALFLKYLLSLFEIDDVYCNHRFLRDSADMKSRNIIGCFVQLFLLRAVEQSIISFFEYFNISNIQLTEHSPTFVSLSFNLNYDDLTLPLNGQFSTAQMNNVYFKTGSFKPISLSYTLTNNFPGSSNLIADRFSPFSKDDYNNLFLKNLLHTYLFSFYKKSNDYRVRQLFDTHFSF